MHIEIDRLEAAVLLEEIDRTTKRVEKRQETLTRAAVLKILHGLREKIEAVYEADE